MSVNSGELNAAYIQIFSNGSTVSTPCYIDITKTPIQVTSLTPVDETAFAGPQTDAYVLFNGQQYREYEIIGGTIPIKEG